MNMIPFFAFKPRKTHGIFHRVQEAEASIYQLRNAEE
jgi:hypothetical protein